MIHDLALPHRIPLGHAALMFVVTEAEATAIRTAFEHAASYRQSWNCAGCSVASTTPGGHANWSARSLAGNRSLLRSDVRAGYDEVCQPGATASAAELETDHPPSSLELCAAAPSWALLSIGVAHRLWITVLALLLDPPPGGVLSRKVANAYLTTIPGDLHRETSTLVLRQLVGVHAGSWRLPAASTTNSSVRSGGNKRPEGGASRKPPPLVEGKKRHSLR